MKLARVHLCSLWLVDTLKIFIRDLNLVQHTVLSVLRGHLKD
jgi:hypothetical protein